MLKTEQAKSIVKTLKERKRGQRGNITFRLSTDVVTQFKKACGRQGVKPGEVIEELMKEFTQSFSK